MWRRHGTDRRIYSTRTNRSRITSRGPGTSEQGGGRVMARGQRGGGMERRLRHTVDAGERFHRSREREKKRENREKGYRGWRGVPVCPSSVLTLRGGGEESDLGKGAGGRASAAAGTIGERERRVRSREREKKHGGGGCCGLRGRHHHPFHPIVNAKAVPDLSPCVLVRESCFTGASLARSPPARRDGGC